MSIDVAVLAGSISTVIFAGSMMPMVLKAVRTRDLASYSFANLFMSNVGNLVHSVYIYSLPVGPIWALHTFYLVTAGIMLGMYLRHNSLHHSHHGVPDETHVLPDTVGAARLLHSNQPGGTSP